MKKKNYLILGGVFLFLFFGLLGVRVYSKIVFNIHCGDRLKRAADANTIALAQQELRAALSFIEEKNLTSGYTSVLYNTPDEDLGFWYTNLKASLQELNNLDQNTSSLEKSNMLIKLRETLLDQGDKGVKLTVPAGIAVYPHNAEYSFAMWCLALLAIICGGLGIPEAKKKLRRKKEVSVKEE